MKRDVYNAIDAFGEQATGMFSGPDPLNNIYNEKGEKITPKMAQDLLIMGKSIEITTAGSSTYRLVAEQILGCKKVQVIDWTSSAGDWSFGIKYAKDTWITLFQENRFPYHGFRYTIDFEQSARTFEKLCNSLY